MNFKSKFPKDLLNEIKWKDMDISKCDITYINRGSPNNENTISGRDILRFDKLFIVLKNDFDETYIPYHRIVEIRHDGKKVFERRKTN